MLLFLTREAFWRRSMDERRCDDGDPGPKMFSVLRFCQNRRGEVTSEGEDWKGEESGFPGDFCMLCQYKTPK